MTQDYYGTKRVTAWPAVKAGGDEPGYGVQYADGYVSWSPKDVFEEAYQPVTALSFGHALVVLKGGQRIARSGWNGKRMYLEFQVPDVNSKMTLPYIYMVTAQGDLVPWLAPQTDILSSDWMIVNP